MTRLSSPMERALAGLSRLVMDVNVLSYAGRSSTVLVDFSLATPTATDIGTVLDNFAVIMGGNANDVLKASSLRGTVLIGNGGDDVLSVAPNAMCFSVELGPTPWKEEATMTSSSVPPLSTTPISWGSREFGPSGSPPTLHESHRLPPGYD